MRRKGFTLLELVVVLAVLTILSGILIPVVKQILDKARVSKVLTIVDRLKNASKRYYQDTRQFATEDGSSNATASHQLAFRQDTVSGWDGPYIEGPLSSDVLPFGTSITLRPAVKGYDDSGYYLLGPSPGPNTLYTDKGQEIIIDGVETKWAEKLDEAIDGTKDAANGRVNYDSSLTSGKVAIFIYDPLGQTQ